MPKSNLGPHYRLSIIIRCRNLNSDNSTPVTPLRLIQSSGLPLCNHSLAASPIILF
ncbi:hypothetical protein CPB83DRAFT_864287 [Crepidotus variabilis]|uniref:Uncharacterized protein n=1 Tax=Crepidotus variabilis TaxID=179855 RepID=A0A9P6E4U6_9AGAR|nr:hypothetical protein CPB83DRAFT_864287 [Crepidotus variabilis]